MSFLVIFMTVIFPIALGVLLVLDLVGPDSRPL
jgi:hypothetical protein